MLKRSSLLFGFLAVLGVVLLLLFFTVFYLSRTWAFEILTVKALIPGQYYDISLVSLLVAGTVLLTMAISGLVRQCARNHEARFVVLAAFLVPLLVFGCLASMTFLIEFPQRNLTITDISMDGADPLTFSFEAKSLCCFDIYFDKVFAKDCNQTIVASVNSEMVEVKNGNGKPYYTMNFIGELPPGAEKKFSFSFDASLPSGNYVFWVSTWDRGGFKSLKFALPLDAA